MLPIEGIYLQEDRKKDRNCGAGRSKETTISKVCIYFCGKLKLKGFLEKHKHGSIQSLNGSG